MRKSRVLAIDAILATLIIVFTLVPISIGPIRLAFLMLLPVLIACQIERFATALFAGMFLGLLSLITSIIVPTPLSALFYNPLVSVLPRMMIAVIGWCSFKIINNMLSGMRSNRLRFMIASVTSAILGVVTNTGLVLAMMWSFFNGQIVGGMVINAEFFTTLVGMNFVVEVIACPLLVPPVVMALKRALRQPLNSNGTFLRIAKKEAAAVCDTAKECSKAIECDNASIKENIINGGIINEEKFIDNSAVSELTIITADKADKKAIKIKKLKTAHDANKTKVSPVLALENKDIID